MSESMTLVTLVDTGHVLAAVTQTAPGGDLEPADLVGDALPVKRATDTGVDYTLHVPSAFLEVKTAPFDPAVVANPQKYVINGGGPVKLNSLSSQSSAPSPALLQHGLNVTGFVMDADIKAFIGGKPGGNAVQAVVSGELKLNPPAAADVTIELTTPPGAGGTPGVPISLVSGEDYGLLVAIAGMPLFFGEETIA